ncbi:MAG: helix-turn-helix domain-containing protein [Actinobacteria bacterium]|nr:helix-turn-helix domain-containing protein [Actinomycetota bacterium]
MPEGSGPDDALLTAADLARLTGVSASTFTNWTRRNPALVTVTLHGGVVRFRRRDVIEFCTANPRLRVTAKVQRALRSPTTAPPSRTTARTETAPEIESLRALARDLRNAAHQNLEAMLTAARLAEETARSHREQLEQLAASIAAYDAALSQLTAPSTMND